MGPDRIAIVSDVHCNLTAYRTVLDDIERRGIDHVINNEFTRVHFHHTDEQFDQMFAATPFTGDGPVPTVVGYGDIHDAYQEVHRGRILFNAGSVGNPLDEPTAGYVVVHGEVGAAEPGPFSIEFVRVPYDIEAEVAVAAACGMPALAEYARELRTAVYRGLAPLSDGPPDEAPATAPRPAPPSTPSVRR